MSTTMKSLYQNSQFVRAMILVFLLAGGMATIVLSASAQEQVEPPTERIPSVNSTGAALPEEIGYQGQLVDNNGIPQIGSYTMEFRVFTGPPDFLQVYSETQTVATDAEGLFNVMIGAVQPGLGDALGGGDAWLEVQLEGEILAPRQPVGSVAYALYAQHLVGGTGDYSVIGGGLNNFVDGPFSTIGGGEENRINFQIAHSTIGGGLQNLISAGEFNTVGGGAYNAVSGSNSSIGGGWFNFTDGDNGTIGGGSRNQVDGENGTISGGIDNYVFGDSATIGGGEDNRGGGDYFTTSGGKNNKNVGDYTTISGGNENEIRAPFGGSANGSTIGGGSSNYIQNVYGTIAGGYDNEASGDYSSVLGGQENTASGIYSSVLGGQGNTASGEASVAMGYESTAVGKESFAGGWYAQALHDNSFVWSSNFGIETTAARQFLIDGADVGIGTNSPETSLHLLGYATGDASNLSSHISVLENALPQTSADVLALSVSGLTDPDQSTNFITFFDADGPIAAIDGNGSGGVTYKTSGADFAEYLPLNKSTNADLEPGTVLALTGDTLSLETSDAQRVFVVSSAAGFVGNADEAEGNDDMALVAFIGQVPVRVRGPVLAGDLLVASGLNDGTATAISPDQLTPSLAAQIVGQALESSKSDDVSLILTLVGGQTDAYWASLLTDMQSQLNDLETRLAALEATILESAGANNE